MNVREAAQQYIEMGWYPIPLNPKTKECRDSKWRTTIYKAADFGEDDNLGIRLVNAKDARDVKLVSADLDCEEAVKVARAFFPDSGAAWGRDSKPLSQMLYVSPFEKTVVFKDMTDGKTLLEIRVDHQSMAPPSIHPVGERLRWIGDDDSPEWRPHAPSVDAKDLLRAARLTATAALVARHYPPAGARHEWGYTLAGALKQHDLTEEEAVTVIRQAGWVAHDGKIQDRVVEFRKTFARSDDDPTAGTGKLAELMGGGDKGANFVESIRRVWGDRSQFRMDEKGKKILSNSQENIRRALELMEVQLSFNDFSKKFFVSYRGALREMDDPIVDRLWLETEARYRFRPNRDYYETVIRDTARAKSFHPVRDYLGTLEWDGTPRIDTWLTEYGGAKDSEYTRVVGAMVLIAAVRRVRHEGCKFDEMLVLESTQQGKNKSTALATLCPERGWFADDLPLGLDSKQIIERTSGKWIIEAQEIVGMRKTQVEQLKSFLSRQVDGPVRMAYARSSHEVPRQFVIVGTTNSVSYLRDPSGNRRFWPVTVRMFDVAKLEHDRDQIWAEASKREAEGESIRLPPHLWPAAAKQQEIRRTEDPWETLIVALVDHGEGDQQQRIDPEDLWDKLGIPMERRDDRGADRVSQIMQRLGFRRVAMRSPRLKKVIKGWGRDLIEGIWRPAGWE